MRGIDTSYRYRSISMNRYTPSIKLTAHLCSRTRTHVLKYIACAMNIKM